jgi:hypothetical protein
MSQQPYNVDLMLAIREQITTHPETHSQHLWARRTECGTTYCIAGWAAVLSGYSINWLLADHVDGEEISGQVVPVEDGGADLIADAAQELLGLAYEERDGLFYEFSNPEALAVLDRMIEAGKNGERVQL